MKTLTFLAVLILGATANAGNRHSSGRHYSSGHHHGGYHGSHGYRSSYYRSYPSYYRSYPYRSYGYGGYGYGGYGYGGYGYGYGYGYRPAISLSFLSTPRYYGGYSPSYRSSANYDDSLSIEAQVQIELRRKGYYRGAVDGDIGPASRAAIRSWQDAHGLSTTGRIDSALLRSLGI